MTVIYLIIKEFKQMMRNILLPIVFILIPLALTNGVPRLATQEVKGLKFAVVDNDHSMTTQRLIQEIDASKYLDLSAVCSSYDEAMQYIDSGDADVIMEFPNHYGRDLLNARYTGTIPQVMISANSTNGTKGTIEQINVTPVKKWEFIVSKIVPYVIIGVLMVMEGMLVARGVFGFWPQGSLPLIFLLVLLFCMLVSSFGLIISNYSSTIQQAALTMFFFLVIFLLMSGLLTPIQSMPDWAQTITYFNPMRYFVECIRAIYIKGSSLSQLSFQFSMLVVYSCFTWAWAIVSYKKNA